MQGVRAWAIAMASMVFYLSMEKVWNFRLLATPWYAAQPLLVKLVTMQVRLCSVAELLVLRCLPNVHTWSFQLAGAADDDAGASVQYGSSQLLRSLLNTCAPMEMSAGW
jgi:hypothetical protein